MTQAVALAQVASVGVSEDFKNRIINGAMMIDQRNAGASVTPASNPTYTLDRWVYTYSQNSKFSVQQNAGSVTPPTGFTNYIGFTSLAATSLGATDYFILRQKIEGYNVADLDFGKSTAKTITISFWVRSSLTGTFGGSISNSAEDRNYPFTYTISSANTWEQKSITITGDTTGTWLTTTGVGLELSIGLGVGTTYSGTAGAWTSSLYVSATGATNVAGTNGATFYITGVQLEVGSTASGFDYRPYGTELQLCQRYYYKNVSGAVGDLMATGYILNSTSAQYFFQFPVTLRTAPTALEQTGTAANYGIVNANTTTAATSVPSFNTASQYVGRVNVGSSGLTANSGSLLRAEASNVYLAWSAEL